MAPTGRITVGVSESVGWSRTSALSNVSTASAMKLALMRVLVGKDPLEPQEEML